MIAKKDELAQRIAFYFMHKLSVRKNLEKTRPRLRWSQRDFFSFHQQARSMAAPTHLVVFTHGFLGVPHAMQYSSSQLQAQAPETLCYVSFANGWATTGKGIDVCASRLATDIRRVVAAHPTLAQISFVGVSMGGTKPRPDLP